jgi:chorismate mutase/prephenate dehydratase
LLPAATTDEALAWAEGGAADAALLPIENSIEGAVNRTLDLLRATSLHISGEIALPIRHQLLSRAAHAKEVLMVLAHPQALAQCRQWLDHHLSHAERRPAVSNGEAARLSAQNPTLAAIAGNTAASIYDLPVLADNIEDQADNTTRFVLISPAPAHPTGNDTTSLICVVPDGRSGMAELLTVLAHYSLTITKLQSRPIPGRLWRYTLYIDVDGHRQEPPLTQALTILHERRMLVKILGSYPKAH